MAQFKGIIFTSTRIYTDRTFGPEAVERCFARVGAADAAVLQGVSAVGWYPVEPILHYHHALQELYGRNDPSVCENVGRFSAEWAFNTVLKIFLRFKSPQWLMEKHGSVWTRYHDTGRWELGPSEPKRILGRLHDFEVRDPAFCARLRGWISGAVSMTGGRNVRIAAPACRCDGDEYCEFDIRWD
jgi:hypothetical protein